MIPKTIHYCWFGRNPLPKSAVKCINSWRKFFPDYEIKEWNEDNFDVKSIPYTAEAYEARKYAFVSDYARFWILYHFGGVYFDTDVEVIKPMDDIIEKGPFMGIEVEYSSQRLNPRVNPGLGIAVDSGHEVYKRMIDYYSRIHFMDANGFLDHETVVPRTTRVLVESGLQPHNCLQQVAGIWIYPKDYFNPLDSLTGRLFKTENTRSIHWYTASWRDSSSIAIWLSRMSHRMFGLHLHRIKRYLKKLLSHGLFQ